MSPINKQTAEYKKNHKLWLNRTIKSMFLVSDVHKIMFYNIPKNMSSTIRKIIIKQDYSMKE